MSQEVREDASERLVEPAWDDLLEGCQVIGFDYRYLYLNAAAARHARRPREEVLGRTMMESFPGVEETEMFAVLRDCMRERVPKQMDNEFVYPDGGSAWFELRFEPVVKGTLVLSLDVTDRKRVERTFQRTHRALATLSECNQALVRAATEAEFIEGLCQIVVTEGGYRAARVCVIGPDATLVKAAEAGDAKRFAPALALRDEATCTDASLVLPLRIHGKTAGVLEIIGDDSDAFDGTGEMRLLKELALDLGFGIETLRDRASAALQSARWESTFDAISDSVAVISPHHDILAVNQAGADLVGLPRERILGKKCFGLLHGTDRPLPNCPCLVTAHTLKMATSTLEENGRVQDVTVWPLQRSAGGLNGFVHVIKDVTERKKVERALRESERRLATLLDNLPGVAYRCKPDADWTMVFVSQACEDLTGYPPADILDNARRSFGDLIHPEDRALVWREVQRGIEEGAPFILEYRIRDAKGREKWVWEKGRSVKDEAGTLWLEGFIIDVTDQRKNQQQVEMTQRLEAVGRLAGGVAHDFNNLLLVIGSSAELALDDLPKNHPVASDLREIQKASQRAASLTRQLLAFSRRQILEPKVINLNDVVCSLEGMLRRLVRENVVIATQLAVPLGSVRADPGQLEQVIVNLVVNARDAMPEGGSLHITTHNLTRDDGPSLVDDPATQRAEEYVRLSVTDTGAGMSAETTRRVFEPFFTTKEQGRGTGLGLATVYGIVTQSGGCISVHSQVGKGTTFHIDFPRATGPAERVSGAAVRKNARGETVLVVEDSEAVRKLAARILTGAGYRVLTAAHGAEALAAYGRSDLRLDMLLTDVVMPDMSGSELAERMKAILPGLKVLFMSGYTDDAIVHHGVLDADTHFLAKPFTVAELTAKVREVLDTDGGLWLKS